jgi:hypothetical protein
MPAGSPRLLNHRRLVKHVKAGTDSSEPPGYALILWQSDSSKTSASTPSSAQNNASFRSRKKPAPSSRHSLNFGCRIAGSGLAAARVRFRGKSRLRKKGGSLGMAGGAKESGVDARCRQRRGRGSARLRRRGGRSRRREKRSALRHVQSRATSGHHQVDGRLSVWLERSSSRHRQSLHRLRHQLATRRPALISYSPLSVVAHKRRLVGRTRGTRHL